MEVNFHFGKLHTLFTVKVDMVLQYSNVMFSVSFNVWSPLNGGIVVNSQESITFWPLVLLLHASFVLASAAILSSVYIQHQGRRSYSPYSIEGYFPSIYYHIKMRWFFRSMNESCCDIVDIYLCDSVVYKCCV